MAIGQIVLILRAVQALFALIVLGLCAYVASYFHSTILTNGFSTAFYLSFTQVNFMIFASVWTLLAVAYLALAPLYFPRAAHKFALLAVDALTMLFWFAGFIALAVLDGALFGDFGCAGGSVCGSADAGAAFGAFEWLLFVATTVLGALETFRGGNSGSSYNMKNQGVQPHMGV